MEREIAQAEVVDADTGEINPARSQNSGRSLGNPANLKPWRPGQSGNPGGRPRQMAEVVELARQHTITAIETLVEIAQNKKASSPARVAAADALLDRGWGKAPQHLQIGASGSFDEWLKARAEALRAGREG